MITLFHAPRSRSARMIWLLEELGAPYEIRKVNVRRGDGSGAVDPANPHPHGKVPAIDDDGTVVFESTAIAAYLTDRFPANGIGPVVGDPKRGPYLSWLAYYSGVLEPAFVSKFLKVDVPRGTAGWVAADEAMAFVIGALSRTSYLLGEKFSAVDVLYGSTFALFANGPLLPPNPAIEDYVKRCIARPAYRSMEEKGG